MMNEERNDQNKGYKNFRTTLDIGMGIFYIFIGALILYVRYFGTIELPAVYANVLGGLMVLYGLFRIYRGYQGLRVSRRPKSGFPLTRDRDIQR